MDRVIEQPIVQPATLAEETDDLVPRDTPPTRPLLFFTTGPTLKTCNLPGLVLRFVMQKPEQFIAYSVIYTAALIAGLSSIIPYLDLLWHSGLYKFTPWCLQGRLWGILNMALAVGTVYVVSVHLLFYKICLNYRTIVIQVWMEPALQIAEKVVPLLALTMSAFETRLLSSSTVCDSTTAELTVRYLCCEAKYHWFAEDSFVRYSSIGLAASSLASMCIYHIFDTDVKNRFVGAYKQTCPEGCEWKPDHDR
jgi:hypothetical protein